VTVSPSGKGSNRYAMARRRASVGRERISTAHPAHRRSIEYSAVKNLLDCRRNQSAQGGPRRCRPFVHAPDRGLDSGVRTGRSLNAFVIATRAVGVDYSDGMLRQPRIPAAGGIA
jgi:hypothetical protein